MDDAKDPGSHPQKTSAAGTRLRDAMRKARVAQTVRNDVIVDLREIELARLEVLADALAPVFSELPEDAEQFECSLVPGGTPRLWIDMLSFVDMGRDKRTYRFVSETRSGRQIMAETLNVADIADQVTGYIAHRLVERERSLTVATPVPAPAMRREQQQTRAIEDAGSADDPGDAGQPVPASPSNAPWRDGVQIALAYLAGLLTGAAGIILLAIYLTN